jgi:MEDS: MEthanogen/methylotroph, DcmR Sensory domain
MIGSPRLSYHQGDHVCTLFASPEEQLQAAMEYIRGGLARGERCLYVCCEHELHEFRAALKQAGIAVESEEARGALVLLTKYDGHLKDGSFDPDRMISMLDKAVKDALDAGFNGLCAAGDMNWLLDGAPGSERLAEYEARLNRFYQSNRALGLCLYNLGTMPPAALDDCLATHPFVRVEGQILLSNPFYELPETAISRIPRPAEVHRKIREIRSA